MSDAKRSILARSSSYDSSMSRSYSDESASGGAHAPYVSCPKLNGTSIEDYNSFLKAAKNYLGISNSFWSLATVLESQEVPDMITNVPVKPQHEHVIVVRKGRPTPPCLVPEGQEPGKLSEDLTAKTLRDAKLYKLMYPLTHLSLGSAKNPTETKQMTKEQAALKLLPDNEWKVLTLKEVDDHFKSVAKFIAFFRPGCSDIINDKMSANSAIKKAQDSCDILRWFDEIRLMCLATPGDSTVAKELSEAKLKACMHKGITLERFNDKFKEIYRACQSCGSTFTELDVIRMYLSNLDEEYFKENLLKRHLDTTANFTRWTSLKKMDETFDLVSEFDVKVVKVLNAIELNKAAAKKKNPVVFASSVDSVSTALLNQHLDMSRDDQSSDKFREMERTIANLSNQVEQYKSNAKESRAIVNNMMKEDGSASKSTKRSLFDRSPNVSNDKRPGGTLKKAHHYESDDDKSGNESDGSSNHSEHSKTKDFGKQMNVCFEFAKSGSCSKQKCPYSHETSVVRAYQLVKEKVDQGKKADKKANYSKAVSGRK